jgi:hypothetical protein
MESGASNLQVSSNIMIDDEAHQPHRRFIPGDLFAMIYREPLNPEFYHQWLTPQ